MKQLEVINFEFCKESSSIEQRRVVSQLQRKTCGSKTCNR